MNVASPPQNKSLDIRTFLLVNSQLLTVFMELITILGDKRCAFVRRHTGWYKHNVIQSVSQLYFIQYLEQDRD